MSMQRQSITKGPGTVQLGTGPVLYDASGIESDAEITTEPVPTSMFGRVDSYITDKRGMTRLTPSGQITSAIVAALHPHQTPDIGASLFGTTDTPLKIHSKAGTLVTWLNSAVTGCPDLILSPRKTALGQVELTSLLKNEGEPATAEHYYTIASEAWSDSTFATANVLRLAYSAAWGSTWTDIETEDGWTVGVELDLTPRVVDNYGTIDMYLSGVSVTARGRPVNLSETLLNDIRFQGAGSGIGASMRGGDDFVITGAGSAIVVTLKDAAPLVGPLRYGNTELRAGEVAFVAERNENAGAFGALYSVAVS